MKKKTGVIIGVCVGVVVVIAVAALIAIMTLRVNIREAEQIALDCAGGGEIVEHQVSNDGLWSEYSFTIQNGDSWYQVDIDGFGTVEEIETGSGMTWID